MTAQRQPRVVVTIHGIQTHGRWQKEITPYLARHGLVPYHIDYGRFSVLKLIWPFTRNAQVELVRKELQNLVVHARVRRISVIAHSFGTFLAMEALLKENGNLLYDRVVLTGSILPLDFPWKKVVDQTKWVMAVRNERAGSDWVVTLASFLSRGLGWVLGFKAGASGRHKFSEDLPALIDAQIEGHHSQAHNPIKFENWARFIAYPALADDLLNRVTMELQAFRQKAAELLQEDVRRLRVNLFAPLDGKLRIVPGAHDNMTFAPELDLEIDEGLGATGTAYKNGKITFVANKGQAWPGGHLPGPELEKINPQLKWVASLPVVSQKRSCVVAIVNVDGLDSIPKLLEDEESETSQAVLLLLHSYVLERFSPCLEIAFRGDQLGQSEI